MEGIDSSNNNYAHQIYHNGNVLAILPLWNNYVSIVWSLQIPDFQNAIQLSDTSFIDALNDIIN